MWKLLIFLSVAVLLIGANSATAGESLVESEALVIDSLVLSGDVQAAMRMLSTIKLKHSATGDHARAVNYCDSLRSQLEEVLAHVDYAAAQPVAYADSLVCRVLLEEHSYSEASAGVNSFSAFTEFKRFSETGENLRAVKWYQIARFFRDAFVDQAVAEIETNYRMAKQQYRKKQYQDASDVIGKTVVPPSQNKRLTSLADSLRYLDAAVQQKLIELDRYERSWGSTEPVVSRITLTAGANTVFRPELESTDLNLRNRNGIALVRLQRIPAHWTGGGSLECMLSVTRAVQIGLGLGYGQYDITTPEVVEPVYFAIDMHHYSMVLLGRYYFRSLVGLRPSVTLGIGAVRIERYSAGATVLLKDTDSSHAHIAEDFILEGRNFTSTTVVAEGGMEYSPGAGRGIVTGPSVSLSYNFEGDRFVKQTNLTVSIKVGYKL